jgi:hypothetical protein
MTWHPDGIFFKMGVLDFCWWNGSAHECGLGCISWSHILGKKTQK